MYICRPCRKQLLPWRGKPHSHSWKIVTNTCTSLIFTYSQIVRLPWCYICVQLELWEVATLFILLPGKEATGGQAKPATPASALVDVRKHFKGLIPISQAVEEMAWQLLRIQTVTSAARKLAVPIKFQNIVTSQLSLTVHVYSNCIMHWNIIVIPISFQ